MSHRSDIKDKIKAILDAVGTDLSDSITVYEAGMDLIKTPCVVINPSTPYLVPVTMAVDSNVQVFVDIYIVSNRSSVLDSMDQMEQIRMWVTQGIKEGEAPIGRWTSFGAFGGIEVGGTTYAASIVSAMFMAQDT